MSIHFVNFFYYFLLICVRISDIMHFREEMDIVKVATSVERLNELFDADPQNDTAIAEKLNVSKQTISSWRTGRRSPKKSVLIKISDMYGVSIEWLMGFDVEKMQHIKTDYDAELKKRIDELQTIEARILATGVDNMPKEKREQALNIMQTIFEELKKYTKE